MKVIRHAILGVVVSLLFTRSGAANSESQPSENETRPADARTAQAVMAADAAWLDAEVNGNYQFLEWFLADGYESIDATGSIFSRQALIEKRRKQGKSAAFSKAVHDWRASHPSHAEVKFFGDTAVLTWVTDDPNSKTPIYSCDIFVYQHGHWHAIYSQHSTAEG
jgi:hypothetical protein